MIEQRLSVRDLKRKLDAGQGLLILDVRQGFCDSDKMIPGAIHIDARDINPHLFNLDQEVEVVVYGTQDQDDATVKVADALQAAGFNAGSLQGGWNAWLDAGFPTEDRQERLLPRTKAELHSTFAPLTPEVSEGREAPEGREATETPEAARGVVSEARERVQETAEGATHALGDLASRALRLVQTLIRR